MGHYFRALRFTCEGEGKHKSVRSCISQHDRLPCSTVVAELHLDITLQ